VTPVVSIIIPTYNSADRIHIPLAALAAQDGLGHHFELLVVDNNSTDQTARAADSDPATEKLRCAGVACRVVHEPRLGTTYARIRGAQEARGELICFLDDDNAPESGYLAEGIRAFQDPMVGLLISRVSPHYLCGPPRPSMARRDYLLANNRMGDHEIHFRATGSLAPTIGAGMWVRRSAFFAAIPCANPALLLPDRVGNDLCGGGDIEFGVLIGRAGFDRVYCPKLRLRHIIPPKRLEFGYFCRLVSGVARSNLTLESKYLGRRPASWLAALFGLILTALVLPLFVVAKPDGIRDWIFHWVTKWADWLGPHSLESPERGHT
jgi:glycosyltransferase involved in cell wall biosynthesis